MNRQVADAPGARTRWEHSAHHPGHPTPPRLHAPVEHAALRVLVVEEEERAAKTLVQNLTRRGYRAESVATGTQALQVHHQVDLILLDLDLTDLDGLEVCRGIRAVSDTPIIAVTERGSELDRVLGLQAGADDYMVKPYGFHELLARIGAVMRRVRPSRTSRVIEHGPLRIDPVARKVTLHDRPVDLTRKEFDLLRILALQPGAVVSRRQLMSQVWDDAWSHKGRTIDTHVSSLRGKLGSSDWIVTVRGVGFRLGNP
ncbi:MULTISPECIES: response regulator transcription factor [Streptomyces]|uniref:DNA-binding response regulator n=2 Tax=Streptomyces TaxID=1883 RepID=A0A2U9P180_STRAS|nr:MULTISPECIES: response regulator transcription factor [Streptomyces]AWT42958.1 DNA-binding response regulator [Streptomyces actuosus]MBM4824915.1 response regulator transcription factor [Streptomyces actuosus]GHF71449.1 two-component system, response regulator [Streptomyces griseosporeus]